MFDKLMVWLCFKVANHNARKWTVDQLRTRIHELDRMSDPGQAHITLLKAYKAYWYEKCNTSSSYPFGP